MNSGQENLLKARNAELEKQLAQKNRELEIEAALEEVRARTMAMQKSAELKEVIRVVCEQFVRLNILAEHAGFIVDYKERDDMHIWLADKNAVPSEITIPYFDSPYWNSFIKAKEKGEDFFTNHLSFEEKNKFYNHLFQLFPVPDNAKEFYFNCAGLAISTVLLNNAGLYIENFSGIPYSDEENNTLMRFGKVFQQTYTRFLDLQNAEAQAREAQIEAALERVRSRTMGMHQSEEIADIVGKIFKELKQLDLVLNRVLIWIFNDREKYISWWSANQESEKNATSYRVDYNKHPVFLSYLHAWQKRKPLHLYTLSGDTKKTWEDHLFTNTELSIIPEAVRNGMREEGTIFTTSVISDYGLMMVGSFETLSDANIDIIQRFGRVFQQSYTRYLDVQKAEAQAREAQIQLALERVRARTMAMQHSSELKDVAAILFKHAEEVGVNSFASGVHLWNEDTKSITIWSCTEGQMLPPFRLPYTEDPAMKHIYEAAQNGKDFHVEEMGGQALKEHYDYLFSFPDIKKIFGNLSDAGFPVPTFQIFHAAYFSRGYIMFITYEPCPQVHYIFKRFAKVFEQTYTRFLDLQKAETQAREAQIEAALERVRSRTLAMQKSDELAETAAVVFKQLIGLGIEPNRLYIGIIKEESSEIELWATDEEGTKVSTPFTASANKSATINKMYEGWKTKKKSIAIDLQGKELTDYLHYLSEELHATFKVGLTQKRRVQSVAYFSQGCIGMASPEPQPEETTRLLERFAAVFNLTYTRFNDLKIAEAHALQAEKDLIEIKAARKKAEETLAELQATQKQLIQSEKMASLGELTAGIAHEIQNPLNFVNNFSEVNKELVEELNAERLKQYAERNEQLENELLNDIKENSEKINYHGKRAGDIVKGMLQHSRTSSGQKELTDINALCDEYLRLAYHGLRAKDKTFNAKFETDFDKTIEKINIVPQDIGRVILNLINNAFYATGERRKVEGIGYEPTVIITTKRMDSPSGAGGILISVRDNGPGIPQKILDKIFQPFFTTKPTGLGTGLGLSLSYDIIKAHGGEITVETKEEEGTTFIVLLPAG